MVVRRGEIWWASLAPPGGSGPGYRRPVLVLQSDVFNESAIRTVIVAIFTANMRRAQVPGNVACRERYTQLPNDSVVNVSQLFALDVGTLTERVGALPQHLLREVEAGLRLILGL